MPGMGGFPGAGGMNMGMNQFGTNMPNMGMGGMGMGGSMGGFGTNMPS